MFADDGAGPLWENAHPNYVMEPDDYDLPAALAADLLAWNGEWCEDVRQPGPRRHDWVARGRVLSRRVAEHVSDYADVVYEP
jgi:hypothetical protein